MPNDPPQWTDRSRSKERKLETVSLPTARKENEKWVWLNEWSVQPLEVAFLGGGYGAMVDEEGWEYGSSFNNLNRGRFSDRAVRRDVDTVRRRRWTRVRAPKPAPLHDLDRAMAVFLQVDKDRGADLVLRASSGVRFYNATPVRLEVGAESETWPGRTIPCGVVEPFEDLYLPLYLADAAAIKLRECVTMNGQSAMHTGDAANNGSSSSEFEDPDGERYLPWPPQKIPLVAIESTFAEPARQAQQRVPLHPKKADMHLPPACVLLVRMVKCGGCDGIRWESRGRSCRRALELPPDCHLPPATRRRQSPAIAHPVRPVQCAPPLYGLHVVLGHDGTWLSGSGRCRSNLARTVLGG